jgi:hypothetical protein
MSSPGQRPQSTWRWRFFRSAAAVGALTIETLALGRRGELGVAFAHDRPNTLALARGQFGAEFALDLAPAGSIGPPNKIPLAA